MATDQDVVAGKLNFDTVAAALKLMGYDRRLTEGISFIAYDVLERTQ